MLMTEEQANETWCPMVREAEHQVDGSMISTFNRGSEAQPVKRWNSCIGSACAMWRWERPGNDMRRQYNNPGAERHGYCGLAGRP